MNSNLRSKHEIAILPITVQHCLVFLEININIIQRQTSVCSFSPILYALSLLLFQLWPQVDVVRDELIKKKNSF